MRTTARLDKLKEWTYENVCKGRLMKTPASGQNVTVLEKAEPKVYVGYFPMRADETAWAEVDPLYTAPSILILPTLSYVKYMEEKRFDRYNKVHRPNDLGQGLNVQVLFTVYEDGVREPGFITKAEETGEIDMTLIREGTREGLYQLLNWMDDFKEKLLGAQFIPGTDLFLDEANMTYGLYSDQKFINDKRPIYYGFVNVAFQCYAEAAINEEIKNLL